MNPFSFRANGKLLLSGEYFVLDGAKAIGLPCQYGQSLEITKLDSYNFIFWKSKDPDGTTWFEGVFRLSDCALIETSNQETGRVLQNILQQAKKINPTFLNDNSALSVETNLDFPRLWGLGSSSTLIYNIARWSQADPFQLSKKTMGGSGYDIACAGSDQPILYQKKEGQPVFESVNFDPPFNEQLFFVYLSKKQNSREGIERYRKKAKNDTRCIDEISMLSEEFLKVKTLADFQRIILAHERIVSDAIEMQRIQELYFSDFEGVVKSLGAWGGDFALVATELPEAKANLYFNKKGLKTFLRYKEMIHNSF